jgi:hypothetical protein
VRRHPHGAGVGPICPTTPADPDTRHAGTTVTAAHAGMPGHARDTWSGARSQAAQGAGPHHPTHPTSRSPDAQRRPADPPLDPRTVVPMTEPDPFELDARRVPILRHDEKRPATRRAREDGACPEMSEPAVRRSSDSFRALADSRLQPWDSTDGTSAARQWHSMHRAIACLRAGRRSAVMAPVLDYLDRGGRARHRRWRAGPMLGPATTRSRPNPQNHGAIVSGTGTPSLTSRTARSPSGCAKSAVAVRRAPISGQFSPAGFECSVTMTTTALADSAASAL